MFGSITIKGEPLERYCERKQIESMQKPTETEMIIKKICDHYA